MNDDLAIARAALARAKIQLLRQLAGKPVWQAWQQLREREQNGDPVRSVDDANLKARLTARLDESVPGWQHLAGIEAALSALGAAPTADAPADDADPNRVPRTGDPPATHAVPTPENPTDPMVGVPAVRPSHPRLGVRLDAMDVLQKIRSIEPTQAGGRSRSLPSRPLPSRPSTVPPMLPAQRPAARPVVQPSNAADRPFVPPPWSKDRPESANRPEPANRPEAPHKPAPEAASPAPAEPPDALRTPTGSGSALASAARVLALETELDQMIAEGTRPSSAPSEPTPDGRAARQRTQPQPRPDDDWIEAGFGEAEVEIVVKDDEGAATGAASERDRRGVSADTIAPATASPDVVPLRAPGPSQERHSRDALFETDESRADEASVEIVQFDEPQPAPTLRSD